MTAAASLRRLLALAVLLTVPLSMLASCARVPVSSTGTAPPVTVEVETAIPDTGPVETAAVTSATETNAAAETAAAVPAPATEAVETSPAPTEVTSPGFGLEGPRLVVQLPDNSIAFVSLEGQQAPITAEAPRGLFAAGFGRHAMQDGPIIYARSAFEQPAYYAIDTLAGMVFPLEFIQQDTGSLAVRPLTEGGEPVGPPASLAWGTFKGEGTPSSSLHVAEPNGAEIPMGEDVVDVTAQAGQEFAFTPLRWGPDGSLYYSRMPIGLGGFIPYLAFADLWRYEITSGESTQVVPSPGPGRVCLEELSTGARLLASTCETGEIQVLDLSSDETTTVSLPEGIADALAGSVRFSPGGDRLVYGIFLGTPDEQSSAVAISESLSGASTVIAESEAPGFYAPLAWLDEERVLVQFTPQDESAPASLWALKADGSEFNQVVEGNFLGVLE